MKAETIKRILVIRIDFLGDMVCTTPFLHALKERWPHAELHVLANKYNAAVLDNNPDISKVHYYVYSKNFHKNIRNGLFNALIDRVGLILKLRKLKFDLVVVPNGGINKNSINFARQLNVTDCRWHTISSEFDDRNKEHVETRPMHHELFSGYKLLPELEPPSADKLRLLIYPRQDLALKWHERLKEMPRPKIGIFVSNNSSSRRWEWDKWQQLSEHMALTHDVMVFHSADEQFPVGWGAKPGVYRISTDTVPDMVAAMSHLQLAISADSAPVHISSALNIPVVALFENRPEKYLRWYPVGIKHALVYEGETVSSIKVESVIRAVEKLLNETGNAPISIAHVA